MNLKRFLPLFLIAFSTFITAQEPVKLKLSGFVRNDFYYNSRLNVESIDGTFQYFPKPVDKDAVTGIDKNNVAQSEMLSVSSRLILDVSGSSILGAKTSAKIEGDFAGFSTNYYVFRIRQAYTKLNWDKTELLVGQTWHPLFGNVMPTILSLNAGSPFQPFNRSPQIRLKLNLSPSLSLTAAAIYQMQYTSLGPLTPSASNTYIKNAILPDFFLGTECKTTYWTTGIGADIKTIKPLVEKITSVSAVAYTQYVNQIFQIKAKAVWGENMSDLQMPWGYGVTDSINGNTAYTNFQMISSWINAVYGKKWQVGVFLGYSQNLGTNKNLLDIAGKYTAYGSGFYTADQLLLDRIYRIAPHVSFNLANLKAGLEYDLTTAEYGKIQSNGRAINPIGITNNRVVMSMSYFF